MPQELSDPRAIVDDVSLLPVNSGDTDSALDALAAELTGASAASATPATPDTPVTPAAPAPSITPATPAPVVAAAPVAVAPSAEPAADVFDAVELPPHTKPKSAEAFGRLKQVAKETREALTKQLAEKERALAEALKAKESAPAPGALPAEVATELEDLRRFRISKDAESDPEFRKFDTAIAKNTDQIYLKLAAAGLPKESIEQIKGLGGPENVDWDPILPRLPMTTRRFIEATLVDNERQRDARTEALEAAKQKGAEYVKERSSREMSQVVETANQFLKDLPWTAEKAVPAGATPEVRAAIEADNEFARTASTKLKGFLSDRSPARFAELAVGTLIAFRTQSELAAVKARLDTETSGLKAQLEAVTKERDKAAADLLAIRTAEVPRSRGSGSTVIPAHATGVNVSGSEALDALAAEYAAAR